jgi:hypothetical protein
LRFDGRAQLPVDATALLPNFSVKIAPKKIAMADSFDPYREALIMETETVWPDEFASLAPTTKVKVAEKLHAAPDKCTSLAYVRVHTGFCRKITVTQADLDRVGIA